MILFSNNLSVLIVLYEMSKSGLLVPDYCGRTVEKYVFLTGLI